MTNEVDYNAIEESMQAIIQDDPQLGDVSVLIEEELTFQEGSVVIIYLDRELSPAEMQSLSYGQRNRVLLSFDVWCCHYGMERQAAIRERNKLRAKVLLALMRDTSWRQSVESCWSEGGEFMTVKVETGFMACSSITFMAEVVHVT